MQILKDEVRKNICETALKEFSAKGFQKASMRSIAGNAGITVGNLYRYFRDKEDLFCSVISPAHGRLMNLVNECIELIKHESDAGFIEFISEKILDICKEHKTELLVLFEGSTGTRYESAREDMITVVENFLRGIYDVKENKKRIAVEEPYLLHVIATGFVEGMIMIARHFENAERLRDAASQFISFYFKNVFKRFD